MRSSFSLINDARKDFRYLSGSVKFLIFRESKKS